MSAMIGQICTINKPSAQILTILFCFRNYAQFLHLVAHDHDRAEEYFQRAMKLDPSDGEVIGKYAHFLWLARADLSSAEEAFLDAIAADPTNPFHAGSYAHFLWNTGGEDTCYPLA